ncbi:hypothetical protein M409DRAFT_49348 [Zasmidium cellare ATCC 36951]|uniref:Uncharacterized protein n=1 Tax=Zasmidium cellare ATCC 36951 TaxID=1080233 RepID=A0A6A6D3R1_ZASCE|nr:uncharacterized protein M409DRAFT_49348 [Zasmidium cellare ATCC 36951]KAF2172822.1 hypothetical protein M409DRAFT_49348 [Zasmidium cellare ATCC 36951]
MHQSPPRNDLLFLISLRLAFICLQLSHASVATLPREDGNSPSTAMCFHKLFAKPWIFYGCPSRYINIDTTLGGLYIVYTPHATAYILSRQIISPPRSTKRRSLTHPVEHQAKMRPSTLFTISLFFAIAIAANHRLTDIFNVDTRDPNVHLSSCSRRLNPSDPSTLIYDQNAPLGDRTYVLNRIWYWVEYIVDTAQVGLSRESYQNNEEVRKLLYVFFGVKPAVQNSENESPEPGLNTLHDQKLRKVRDFYEAVADVTTKPQHDQQSKPRLFCDHTFADLQQGYESYLDKNGKPTRKPNSNDFYTLREWEQLHGRDFWFNMVLADRCLGPAIPKNDPTEQIPFAIDPRTNKPNLCADPNYNAMTFALSDTNPPLLPGTEAWLLPAIVVLCPRSLSAYRPYGPDLTQQPEGTHLDSMDTSPITLLHELFHLAVLAATDNKPWHADIIDASLQTIDPSWPSYKAGFDFLRHASPAQPHTYGALQSLTLALYELAYPETLDLHDLESLTSAENYAWFGLTLLLLGHTHQDWSTGVARPGGSPWSPVKAAVPIMFPPGAKIAPITRLVSNSTDEDITAMWQNPTMGATGPITAFDEWTTFVTSVKARL